MTSTYGRDTFDRFGDDLCELIIGYLPLVYKFKYECVSKQWQRTVYRRVDKLCIYYSNELTKILLSPTGVKERGLEKVMIKCQNISQLFMEPIRDEYTGHRIHWTCSTILLTVKQSILEHCSNLTSMDNTLFWTDEEDRINHFEDKYGPQLTTMVCYNHKNSDILDSNKYPNLRRLNILNSGGITRQLFPHITPQDFHIRRLTHIKLSCSDEDEEAIRTIIISNRLLRYVNITSYHCHHSTIVNVLTDLSKLSRLQELVFHFYSACLTHQSFKAIEIIAKNCLLMKKLVIIITNTYHNGPNFILTILNLMKYLPNLVHLELRIGPSNDVYHPNIPDSTITCGSLKYSPNLRYLKVSLKGLKDIFFSDIHKYLPNLSYVSIYESNTTEDIVHCLERLPKLQKVVIEKIYNYYTDNTDNLSPKSIDQLFEVCPRLKSIHLRRQSNIYRYYRSYIGSKVILTENLNR